MSPHNPHGDGRYIPMLDGWRGIAILLVLLFHAFTSVELPGSAWFAKAGVLAGHVGALGVLVFFSISGYLITGRVFVEAQRHGQRISLRTFYGKRVFRILPPLLVFLGVLALGYLAGIVPLLSRDWFALLFLTNYIQGSWYTGHLWSLSVEEHFYLFWPVCLLLLGWRGAMWAGVAIVSAIAIWRPIALHNVDLGPGAPYWQGLLLQHTDLRMDYILMGAIVVLASQLHPGVLGFLRRAGSGPMLLLLAALLGLSESFTRIDLRSVQALLIALLVSGSVVANAPWPRRVLASKPLIAVGKISYSLYLWQELFFSPLGGRAWHSLAMLPVRLALLFAVAWLSFQWIEKPFIRLGRRWLSRSA